MAKLTEMSHPVSDRIMTMRIPLTKDRNATIVSAYAPTMTNPEENKETFYSQEYTQKHPQYRQAPADRRLQCKDRKRNDKWPSALGKYGIVKCNSNGELLLALCTEFDLIVTNTMFKQKDAHKTTWTHPRSRHGHMIDFIITRCRDKMDICSTRTMRGENCGTDHQMLRSRVIFSIWRKHNQKGAMKPVKLNTSKLRNTSHAESLVQEMDNALAHHRKIMTPLAGIASNRLCTIPLKHLSVNMRRNIKTGSTQTTRFYGIQWLKGTKPTKECCRQEAPDPLSKLTKMHAEYYRNIHELESLNGGK